MRNRSNRKYKKKFSEGFKRLTALGLSVMLALSCLTACGDDSLQGSLAGDMTGANSYGSGAGNFGTSSDGQNDEGASGVSSSGNSGSTSSQDAAEIVSSNAAIHDALDAYVGKDSDAIWAGVQVYDGEQVELWRKPNGAKAQAKTQDLYLLDSKEMGKQIAYGVSMDLDGVWFYTREGYCLNANGGLLSRVEPDGTIKYSITVEGGVRTIVQLDDGTIVLLMKDGENLQRLAVLDGEKGEYTQVPNLNLGKDNRVYIASDAEGAVVMNREGFWNVNLESGEMAIRIPMSEYNYTIEYSIRTFQILNGTVKLLSQNSTKMIVPTDIEKYRTVVELFASQYFLGTWMDSQIENFNKENPYYYVEKVTFGEGYGIETEEELLEAMKAGKGPDLFYGNCFTNVHNIIDAGYMEDLVPYMEPSGIYEEDYFATTFEPYKRGNAIYGAPLTGGSSGLWISRNVLGSSETPDAEQLVDALLAYMEPSVLDMPPQQIVKYFLSASESLCDTVDWGNGTCNFHSNLFSKILEVSNLYGVEEENMLPVIGDTMSTADFYNYINAEKMELGEKVYIGYLFDDGAYPAANHNNVLYINGTGENKDGAWALLADLLGEQSQMQLDLVQEGPYQDYIWRKRSFPVNIYAYDMVLQTELEETALVIEDTDGGRRFTYKRGTMEEANKLGYDAFRARYSLNKQDAVEMLEQMYIARSKPVKTLDLQAIIYEEAAYYFSDERSLGDTCDAIQKRAQAYLDGLK